MDKMMAELMGQVAVPMQKWEVRVSTDTRRGAGGTGWSMGKLQPGNTFHGSWIVLGWVKDNDRPRWVKVYDCDRVVSEEPISNPDPNSNNNLFWLKSDAQLIKPFRRVRAKGTNGWPQTIKFAHLFGGVAKATDDYIELTLELNPGMTFKLLQSVMNAWMPQGGKWGVGGGK